MTAPSSRGKKVANESNVMSSEALVVLSHHFTSNTRFEATVLDHTTHQRTVPRTSDDVHTVAMIGNTKAAAKRDLNGLVQGEAVQTMVLGLAVLQKEVIRPFWFGTVRVLRRC